MTVLKTSGAENIKTHQDFKLRQDPLLTDLQRFKHWSMFFGSLWMLDNLTVSATGQTAEKHSSNQLGLSQV